MNTHEKPSRVEFDGVQFQCFHIVLLTQARCCLCEQAQEILERLSYEYWLSISTLDIDSPEGQRLAVQGGLPSPPGLLIEGKPFSYGRLSERKLQRELDRRLDLLNWSSYTPLILDSTPACVGSLPRFDIKERGTH
jgi:hypothetical protein